MAAPAFRAVSAKTYSAPTSGNDTTVPVDAAVQNGDIMVLAFLAGSAGVGYDVNTPSGWTPFGSPLPNSVNDGSDFTLRLSLFWRKAASEPASYTVTAPGISGASVPRTAALLFAVSGAKDQAPAFTFNSGTLSGPGGATSLDATALSITTPADALVAFLAHNWDLYGGSQTVPPGTTPTFSERYKSASNLFYLATGVFAAGGATGDKVQSDVNSPANPFSALLLSFEPAPAAAVAINPLSGRLGQPLA